MYIYICIKANAMRAFRLELCKRPLSAIHETGTDFPGVSGWSYYRPKTKTTNELVVISVSGFKWPNPMYVSDISFNTLRPRLTYHHLQTTFSNAFVLNENIWIKIEIPLRFVPKGPLDNYPALVLIMPWRRITDKPLSEPVLTQSTNAYMRH